MEYISLTNTIIISPEFNEELTDENLKIMSKFNKVIFSDYELNDELFDSEDINIKRQFRQQKLYVI